MANRIQEIALSDKNLGSKIKAVYKTERDIYVHGAPVRGRVFTLQAKSNVILRFLSSFTKFTNVEWP